MRRAAALLAAVVVLAGCGTEAAERDAAAPSTASDSSSPTKAEEDKAEEDKAGHEHEPEKATTKAPADAPACAAVWRDGARLARDYEGCLAGKQFVTVDQEPCSFGQRLVRFGDHFYAVRGGPVNRTSAPLTKDRDYRGAIASCRA